MKEQHEKAGNVDLLDAARKGELARLKDALAAGADPNALDSMALVNASALHLATESGNAACVRALLDAGATVDAREGMYKRTALQFAVMDGYVDIIELLLNSGADLEARDVTGMTAFLLLSSHEVALNEQWESIVDQLIGLGANREARSNKGLSALHITTRACAGRRMKKFASIGLDCNAKTLDGESVLDCALATQSEQCVLATLEMGAREEESKRISREGSMMELANRMNWKKVVSYLEAKALRAPPNGRHDEQDSGIGL